MCGLAGVLSIAAGAAQAVGQAQTASANIQMAQDQAKLEHSAQAREFIVETNAANKDAFQASLEGDRAKSMVNAMGAGMGGNTAGMRSAEQSRQTALSIANARDRRDAAGANYMLAGKGTSIETANQVATLRPNPFTSFSDMATTGLKTYKDFNKG